MMALLDDIKLALRLAPSQTQFDSEIQDLIAAAEMDLIQAGVSQEKAVDHADPLIKRAITVYCKLHFGWENNDYERLERAYDMLKGHLSLTSDYRATSEGDLP